MQIHVTITAVMLFAFFSTSVMSASELVEATPIQVPGATTVNAEQAKTLFGQESAFVDLRKENMWVSGRIPGAIWLEFKNAFSRVALEAEVEKDEKVVFYCSGIRCPRSTKASAKAVEWGYKNVYYFRGGYPEWKKAGYPIE